MSEDEMDDKHLNEGEESSPFEKKIVDEKIIPVGGLYENWFLD
jgi:hypothetical protein